MGTNSKIFVWPKDTPLTSWEAADIADLRHQISPQKRSPTAKDLNRSLQHSILVVAEYTHAETDTKRIIGMAWLIPVHAAGDFRGRVEDVAIDEEYRGLRIGVYMMGTLLQKARELGMKQLDLTSSAKRTAARGLYARFGFAIKDTDTWQLKF